MYCIELKLSGVLEEFSITSLQENKRFECSFHQNKVQVIANLPSRLDKHQTLDILLMTVFLGIFKN